MIIQELRPEIEQRIIFQYPKVGEVPTGPGCYVLTTFSETIIYIGRAINLQRRVEQHLDNPEKRQRTPWGVAYWVCIRQCPTNDIADLEIWWIEQHKLMTGGQLPYFNKIHPSL